MTTYNSLTVPQLKEKLVERNLPVDGLKQDLINRLNANDEEKANAEEVPAAAPAPVVETAETVEPVEPVETVETVETTETAVPVVDNTTTSTTTTTTEVAVPATANEESTIPSGPRAPETKPLPTPEELKKLALDHLNKKLHRANKFGAEQPVIDEINRSINRVEKFGLDLQNPLAIELGIVKKPTPPKQQQKTKKINKNNDNRNRVRKGGNNGSNNSRRGGRRY